MNKKGKLTKKAIKNNLLEGKVHDHFESHEMISDEGQYVKYEDVWAIMDKYVKELTKHGHIQKTIIYKTKGPVRSN